MILSGAQSSLPGRRNIMMGGEGRVSRGKGPHTFDVMMSDLQNESSGTVQYNAESTLSGHTVNVQ